MAGGVARFAPRATGGRALDVVSRGATRDAHLTEDVVVGRAARLRRVAVVDGVRVVHAAGRADVLREAVLLDVRLGPVAEVRALGGERPQVRHRRESEAHVRPGPVLEREHDHVLVAGRRRGGRCAGPCESAATRAPACAAPAGRTGRAPSAGRTGRAAPAGRSAGPTGGAGAAAATRGRGDQHLVDVGHVAAGGGVADLERAAIEVAPERS